MNKYSKWTQMIHADLKKKLYDTAIGKELMLKQTWNNFFGYESKVAMEQAQFDSDDGFDPTAYQWPKPTETANAKKKLSTKGNKKAKTKTKVKQAEVKPTRPLPRWTDAEWDEIISDYRVVTLMKSVSLWKDSLPIANNVAETIVIQPSGYKASVTKTTKGKSKDNEIDEDEAMKLFVTQTKQNMQGVFELSTARSVLDVICLGDNNEMGGLCPVSWDLSRMNLGLFDTIRLKIYFVFFEYLGAGRLFNAIDFRLQPAVCQNSVWWHFLCRYQANNLENFNIMFDKWQSMEYRVCEMHLGNVVKEWLSFVLQLNYTPHLYWLWRGSVCLSQEYTGLQWLNQHSGSLTNEGGRDNSKLPTDMLALIRLVPAGSCLPGIKMIGILAQACASIYDGLASAKDSQTCMELFILIIRVTDRCKLGKLADWISQNEPMLQDRAASDSSPNRQECRRKIGWACQTICAASNCLFGGLFALVKMGGVKGQELIQYEFYHKVWSAILPTVLAAIIDCCESIENHLGCIDKAVTGTDCKEDEYDFGMLAV